MTTNEAAKAKRLIKRLRDLSSDESGAQAYRNYADKVLQDVSGLEHVATLVLSHKNPGMAALRIIQHPRSAALAKMLFDEDEFNVLNQLVSVAYMAKMISLKPKRQRTNSDAKTYHYLAKLYKDGTKALCEKYGYGVSGKKAMKRQFGALRNYIENHENGFDDDGLFDEDADYGDSDLDLEDDPFASDDDDDDLFDEDDDRRNSVSELIEELRAHGFQIIPPKRPIGLPENYRPDTMPEVNFDFTGKATLEIISDRLLSICEGMQLVLNRIYGREVKLIDQPTNNLPLGQLSKLSTEELIRLYNTIGQSIGKSQTDSPLAFNIDQDDDDEGFGPPSETELRDATDLDDQLERLRQTGSLNVGVHMEGNHTPVEEEEPAEPELIPPPVLTDTGGTTDPSEEPREQSAAEMFNNAPKM